MKHLIYRNDFECLQLASDRKWKYKEQQLLRDLFMIVFLYETGARAKELSQLGTKRMEKSCKELRDTYVVTSIGKEHDRDLRFTNKTAELWRLWNQIRPSTCQDYAVIGWGTGHAPCKLSTNGISQMLVRRCIQAGVWVFRAHAIRHAKIKRSRKQVGIEITSVLIDHSTLDSTRGYANIEEDEIHEATILTGLQYNLW